MTRPQKDPEEPVLSQPARKKTLNRVQVFLDAYRTTASVVAAARIAGIDRTMHYQRLERDPLYQKAFARAKDEVSDTIEGELFRRAVHGEKEPVFYKGRKVATITRRSDPLLMFIARGAMPEKYRERVEQQVSGSLAVDIIERIHRGRERLLQMKREDASAAG